MKVTFNKAGVILAYFNIIGYTVLAIVTGNFPPDIMTICWYVAWTVELVLLMEIHKRKKQREENKEKDEETRRLLDELGPLFTTENIKILIEKLLKLDEKGSEEE